MMFINNIYKVIGQIFIIRQPAFLQSAPIVMLPTRRAPARWLPQNALPSVKGPGKLASLVKAALLGLGLAFACGCLWPEGANSAMLMQWRSAPLLHCAVGAFASLYSAWALSKTSERMLRYPLVHSELPKNQMHYYCPAH